jgi:GNAT superfamily N-acetyltransferase
LLEVDRRCPVSAEWRFRYEREPDFFAWPRLVFERFAYVGAFISDQLVGYGMVATYPGMPSPPESAAAPVMYVGDGRVLPEYRSVGIAHALLAAGPSVLEHIDGDETSEGWTLVARQNTPAQRLLHDWSVPGFTLSHAEDLTAHTLLVYPPALPRHASGMHVTVAGVEAVDDLAAAHARINGQRPFAPRLTPALLAESTARGALHGVLLATRQRRVVGAAGLWDPTHARRLVIDGVPPALEAMRAGVQRGLHLAGRTGPSWLQPPSTVPTVTLAPLASTTPGDLRALSIAALHWARENDRLAVHVGLLDDDPCAPGLTRLPRIRLRSTFQTMRRRGAEPTHPRRPPYVDLARV